MRDIEKYFRENVAEAVRQFRNGMISDAETISAIRNRTNTRHEKLKSWLTDYRVFNGLLKHKDVVTTAILDVAAVNPDLQKIDSFQKLKDAFPLLFNAAAAPLGKKAKDEPRNVTSLSSKALWCLSPDFVPIFDSYAQGALFVVARLYGLEPVAGRQAPRADWQNWDDFMGYFEFADIWWKMRLLPEIDQLLEEEYLKHDWHGWPFGKAAVLTRMFDKLLWILGQGSFDGERPERPKKPRKFAKGKVLPAQA